MSKRLIFYTVLLIGFSLNLFGQKITPENAIVSTENWLPNRTINAIFQDSEGLLWVGTTNGLYQYDGQSVRHFTTKPNKENAIFTNLVKDISEDVDDNIIVSLESGLSSYNKRKDRFTTLSPKVENYGRAWRDEFNRVWINVNTGSVIELSKKESEAELSLKSVLRSQKSKTTFIGSINDFELLAYNQLLIASNKGVFSFDLNTSQLNDFGWKGSCSIIQKLGGNEYLLGTANNGLQHVRIDDSEVRVIRQYHFGKSNEEGHDQVTSISTGKYGELLVSTAKNLYQGNRNGDSYKFIEPIKDQSILRDNNILTTYIDESGVYWIGTLRGLYKISPSLLSVERLRIEVPNYNPLNQNINFLVRESKKRYWLGTTDDGFFSMDPRSNKFSRVSFSDQIGRVYKGSNGRFIGINGGKVYDFADVNDTSLKLLCTSTNGISTALEVAPGEWWFGCNSNGLFSFSSNENERYNELLTEVNTYTNKVSTIFTLIKDRNENVWIGSKGDGLLRVNLTSGEIKKYSGIDYKGKISRRILHIKETSDGTIWVGTREGGLYKYNQAEDSFKQFTVADGLPSNVICAVAEDQKKNIVISTNNGLALYNENGLVPFRSYGEKDGVVFGDFSFNAVIEGENGYLFFANNNGLYKVKKREAMPALTSKFYWNGIKPIATEVSTTLVESINYLENRDLASDRIKLEPDHNNFEISFALFSYADPQKNAYAYRMKGHVDDWTYILNGEQSVKLFDVSPDEYTFEIKAENSFGQRLNGIRTLNLTVQPPFWLSSWAFALYFMVFILFTALVIYLFKRWNYLQKKLKEEEALVAIKDQQMVYFADLSHEIKNRLSLILGPLENALSGKKVNQAVLNNLYQQTFRLKRISDQIMDLRKSEGGEFLLQVEKGNVFDSLEKLCKETEPLAIVRDIKLNYSFEKDADDSWFDEELLEIITLNLLNNAIKYTPSGGTVDVMAEMVFLEKNDLPDMAPNEGLYLKCKVADTGIGIPKNEVKNLFNRFYRVSNVKLDKKKKGAGIGLSLVGRLIKKHRGFIDINSEEGDGTRISFYLPMEQSHFQMNEIKLSGSAIPIIEGHLPEYEKLDTSRSTLLLADDNKDILSFLEEHLSSDFNIIKAIDGQQAWEAIQEASVDLVISDLSMPRMDGLELMRRVKSNETLKHIPFIILTGRNSHSQKLACIQNGVDDFVDKPFSLELVTWRIKALLYNRSLMKMLLAG